MEVKLHAYTGVTLPLYNFLNLHINLYPHTSTIVTEPDTINYWLADILYDHSTLVENVVPRKFFDNKRNYIVLQLSQEGIGLQYPNPLRDKLDRIRNEVPVDRVIVMTNCPNQTEYIKRFYPEFQHYLEFNFLEMLTRSLLPSETTVRNPEHRRRFLYLNRRNYINRTLLFTKLWIDKRFVKNSYTSFNPGSYWDESDRLPDGSPDSEKLLGMLKNIVKDLTHEVPGIENWISNVEFPQLPERYSDSNPFNYNYMSAGLAQAHADTDINVVVESNAYSIPQGFFSTEKIYRPISMGQPFIALAQPDYYKNLKKLGYLSYERLFHETHDEIWDDFQRCESVAQTVLKLANLDRKSFDRLMMQTRQIAEHNRRVFLKRTDLDTIASKFTGPLEPLKNYLRYSPF